MIASVICPTLCPDRWSCERGKLDFAASERACRALGTLVGPARDASTNEEPMACRTNPRVTPCSCIVFVYMGLQVATMSLPLGSMYISISASIISTSKSLSISMYVCIYIYIYISLSLYFWRPMYLPQSYKEPLLDKAALTWKAWRHREMRMPSDDDWQETKEQHCQHSPTTQGAQYMA